MERMNYNDFKLRFKKFLWENYTKFDKNSKQKIVDGDKRELQKLLGIVYNKVKEKYGIVDSSYLEKCLYYMCKIDNRAKDYAEKMAREIYNISNQLTIKDNTIKFIDKNFDDTNLILKAINELYELNINLDNIIFKNPQYKKLNKISIRLYKDNKTVKITKLK